MLIVLDFGFPIAERRACRSSICSSIFRTLDPNILLVWRTPSVLYPPGTLGLCVHVLFEFAAELLHAGVVPGLVAIAVVSILVSCTGYLLVSKGGFVSSAR